jgi:hypothetical protein
VDKAYVEHFDILQEGGQVKKDRNRAEKYVCVTGIV